MAAPAHEGAELAGDLLGQLAGRGEHERGGAAPLRRTQPMDERQAEGERLARAGGSAAGDVAPGEGVGDDGGLDGERFGDRGGVEARAQIRGHAEVGEPRGGGGHDGTFCCSTAHSAGTTERLRAGSGAVGGGHPTVRNSRSLGPDGTSGTEAG